MNRIPSAAPADAIVFFGATGDLAYKQIFPALLGLVRDEGLSVPVIGVAKAGWTLDQLKARAADSLSHHGLDAPAASTRLIELLRYVDGDHNDPATFTRLRQELGTACRPLHYLAVPPSLFATMGEGRATSGAARDARLVIEKPFGHDRASARELNRILSRFFTQASIFRIDHYLGKEPVQNTLYTRFANSMFKPILNRDHIRSIQITMAEAFGVQDRGRFYDEAGTMRDVVQNHLLQVLAHLTMARPTREEQEDVHDQKAALLKTVRPLEPAHLVRGQYSGYQSIDGVRAGSTTETFVAIKLLIDSWRRVDVPIYIRAGKQLPVTTTEVTVEFRRPARETFGELVPSSSGHLRFRISSDVSIGMGVRVKQPGEPMVGSDAEMLLTEQPAAYMPPYQRLLGDAMHGVAELFGREDIVDVQWRVVDPILDDRAPPYAYESGSWGPTETEPLIGADGHWRNPAMPAEAS